MTLKDYYAILEIETSATLPEIKKSFRKLAHQYHPDKNPADAYAAAKFYDIKEAHEVLTNPVKKEYYLQQRWFARSKGKIKNKAVITPVNVLKQSIELGKYISGLDKFRMDKEGLQQYLLAMLSNETIDKLRQFKEPDTILEIIRSLLYTIEYLPHQYIKHLMAQLNKLADENVKAMEIIHTFSIKANKKQMREKYTLLFIIAVTIFICLLIFLAGG